MESIGDIIEKHDEHKHPITCNLCKTTYRYRNPDLIFDDVPGYTPKGQEYSWCVRSTCPECNYRNFVFAGRHLIDLREGIVKVNAKSKKSDEEYSSDDLK